MLQSGIVVLFVIFSLERYAKLFQDMIFLPDSMTFNHA